MARKIGFFVQFPHPGGEHNPPSDEMPWNTGLHRRKFLAAPGRYLDADLRMGEAELVFWGSGSLPRGWGRVGLLMVGCLGRSTAPTGWSPP